MIEMFLLNDFAGQTGAGHRALSGELIDRLIERRQQVPDIDILLVTDPFNRLYGGIESPGLDRLKAAGVTVIDTDLKRLRDSNPIYSALWRICCQWFGNSTDGGWLPNPVGGESGSRCEPISTCSTSRPITASRWWSMPATTGSELVTSGNLHDASSRHSNVALTFNGQAALDLMETTLAVARFSAPERDIAPAPSTGLTSDSIETDAVTIQILDRSENPCRRSGYSG